MLLTGVGGAGVATVAALVLLTSVLSQSPPAPPAHVESSGRDVAARLLGAIKAGVLAANADSLGTGEAAARKTGRTMAMQTHRHRVKPTRPTPTHNRAGGTLSINHQSAVVASYVPGTSSTSDRGAAVSDTQTPAITTFMVFTGDVVGGSFTPADHTFTVMDSCM